MSSENVWLAVAGALVLLLNAVVAGPLSVRIARFFANVSPESKRTMRPRGTWDEMPKGEMIPAAPSGPAVHHDRTT